MTASLPDSMDGVRLLLLLFAAAAFAAPRLRAVDPEEPDALLKFALTELQRVKVENREMDDCHGLELASIDTRDEKVENGVKHHLKLKVQPAMIVTPACSHRNVTTSVNVHLQPEVCEAEVWENQDEDGRHQMALLRSSCMQVDELRH
ncbi:uncharacterized protein [Dermacentor andersoni]|uniref:uncharacterized protein n=1 Tax=Dermacentor andersoni TaxID=34620 RepID=UPI002155C4A4|nr:uncharacterized protein LOC126535561 [Dermacentor andersoni]